MKKILQRKNTPYKSTGLSLAIMLLCHPVQDAIPCHKSSLSRNWHDDKLHIDSKAARRKEKLEKYYNRGASSRSVTLSVYRTLTQNGGIDIAEIWNAIKHNGFI